MSGDSANLQKPHSYTSPTKPSKRRRLGNASHTLSQPFKSPFKTPLKSKINTETHVCATTSSPPKDDTKTKAPLSPPSSPQSTPTITRLPPTQARIFPSSELLNLQKQHTRLLNQLSAARSHLETSNQATKIESSNRDLELEALIFKWRAASRAAAEEVFGGARDKVNKMGGVGAMRDRERQSKEKAWGWDDEPKRDEAADDDGERGREDSDGFRIGEKEGEEQDEREEGAEKVEAYGEDDKGYTMDMMLKTLNIDLDIIGYDKGLQKWIDLE